MIGREKRSMLVDLRNLSGSVETVPFRHVIVDDVFHPAYYAALSAELDLRLAAGLSETEARHLFSRFAHYDGYYWTFPPRSAWPLGVFFSAEWREHIRSFFDIPLTTDTIADFHHHLPGSRQGFVHNDYNPAFFVDEPLENGVNPFYYQCSYYDGRGAPAAIERVRAIAVIYYLNGPAWREGDGGETGLYASAADAEPRKKVAPLNNRLLAFECGPTSWHGFLTNTRSHRSSIMQWFHGERETTLDRFDRHPTTPW